MKTVGQAAAAREITSRVQGLRPDSPRQWGKMNIHQMLSHLARAMEWVLAGGDAQSWPQKPSRLIKLIALRVPLPWPRGIPNPNDPASVVVAPEEFDSLKERVVRGIEAMSDWEATPDTPPHPAFGSMSTWDWQRWAYKHADHHLKQFDA